MLTPLASHSANPTEVKESQKSGEREAEEAPPPAAPLAAETQQELRSAAVHYFIYNNIYYIYVLYT